MKALPAVVAAAALLGLGAITAFAPKETTKRRTEDWLEAQVPAKFDGYQFIASAEDPQQTYRMGEVTYETLKPFGIVSRQYTNGPRRFDTVIIASDNSDAFHDPAICFQSQGSVLLNRREGTVPTKTRGDVPATFLETEVNGQRSQAAYLYKGPNGFRPAPMKLMWDMFTGEIKTGRVQEGVFYRFISLDPGATNEDLTRYVGQFLDAAQKSSGGYL